LRACKRASKPTRFEEPPQLAGAGSQAGAGAGAQTGAAAAAEQELLRA
jgi:hypothetical protein